MKSSRRERFFSVRNILCRGGSQGGVKEHGGDVVSKCLGCLLHCKKGEFMYSEYANMESFADLTRFKRTLLTNVGLLAS